MSTPIPNAQTVRPVLLYRALPPDSRVADLLDSLFLALLVAGIVAYFNSHLFWGTLAVFGAVGAVVLSWYVRRSSIEKKIAAVRHVIDERYGLTKERILAAEGAGLPKDLLAMLEQIEKHRSYYGADYISMLEALIPRHRLQKYLSMILEYSEGAPPPAAPPYEASQ